LGHCGYVIKQESATATTNGVNKVDLNVSRIEKTDKKWKKFKFIGVPLSVIGLLMVFSNIGHNTNAAAFVFGFLFTIIGFGLLIVSSIGNWWDRG